jgi:radical SAM protein with 4Fe4S-binding SPASM domain
MNSDTNTYAPNHLLLQWHITNKCNLRCSHCYQEEFTGDEPTWNDLLYTLDQFKRLIERFRVNHKQEKYRSHITITGGEPFAHSNFINLLQLIAADRELYSFAILSNGTLLNKDVTAELRALRPRFVQVSIDGSKNTHDTIRGKGSYNLAVRGLKLLVKRKIPTLISFTASRSNYQEFSDVVKLGRKLGVSRVWADRMVPNGHDNSKDLVLNRYETMDFIRLMNNEVKQGWINSTNVSLGRALQFLASNDTPYKCSAGDSLITVLPNGDVLPCRRLPITTGNLYQESLESIYYESKVMQQMRDETIEVKGCESCFYVKECRGGLRCLSHAYYGDPFRADPGCWLATQNVNNEITPCADHCTL